MVRLLGVSRRRADCVGRHEQILANLTYNLQACTSLVLKSSLLSWIEMQVGDSPAQESMAWFRILENVLVVADTSKLSHATGDQWCSTVCRCLSSLLRNKGTIYLPLTSVFRSPTTRLVDKEMAVLQQGAVVILRLSLIPGVPFHSLRAVLSRAAEYLEYLEPTIHLHRSLHRSLDVKNLVVLAQPPHRAQGLHSIPVTVDPLRMWGEIVEMLWRASMSLDEGTHAWAMLTRRLVVWRALVGEEACQVGEWARKEAVLALRDATR